MKTFPPAPPTASARWIQHGLVLVVVLASLGGLAAVVERFLQGGLSPFDLLWMGATVLGMPPLIWLLVQSPRRLAFEVRDARLRIHTAWGVREVDLAGARVEAVPGVGVGLRLFGIGMPGHAVGLFRAEGETVLAYLSSREHAVWIRPRTGRSVLISPADVPAFLAAAEQR